jgi:hypothetical protein
MSHCHKDIRSRNGRREWRSGMDASAVSAASSLASQCAAAHVGLSSVRVESTSQGENNGRRPTRLIFWCFPWFWPVAQRIELDKLTSSWCTYIDTYIFFSCVNLYSLNHPEFTFMLSKVFMLSRDQSWCMHICCFLFNIRSTIGFTFVFFLSCVTYKLDDLWDIPVICL